MREPKNMVQDAKQHLGNTAVNKGVEELGTRCKAKIERVGQRDLFIPPIP